MNTKDKDNDRGFRLVIIFTLIVAIFCLSVGYASFSTLLQINTKTAVNNDVWAIEFQNMSTATLTGTAAEATAPVLSATTVNLDVEFKMSGDAASYTFDVKNSGTLNAKLSSAPTVTGIPDDVKDKFLVTLTYADGTTINANDTLNAGETKSLKITIAYKDGSTITNQVINSQILLLYVQN